MNLRTLLTVLVFSFLLNTGCGKKSMPAASPITDLNVLADGVPKSGPREGNNYKFFFKVLRQDQSPAPGFNVDAYVKGKSESQTKATDEYGIVRFEDLPFPDAKHPLVSALHYSTGKGDDPREITYPFIESDAYRLKDTQYIPNTATPK